MFKITEKQEQAAKLIAKCEKTLLEGGARSGKTILILLALFARALKYANTWHLAVRLRFSHAKIALWQQTLPEAMRFKGMSNKVKLNHTDYYASFPNGSRLYVGGLDDKDRVEKILGTEWASIFVNEASQVSFDSIETLMTRLNPPQGVPLRFIFDYNPPSKKHWGYKIFHDRQFPDGRPVPENDYGHIRINPIDNIQNLAKTYIPQLEQLSGRKKQRFLYGEYGDEEGALWKRAWFKYKRAPASLERVVVGVDPSGSKTGDEIGIIVVGRDAEGILYVLGDYTLHGTPNEWGNEVEAAYNHHKADVTAAEKNYGGDMVESTITQFGKRNINVKQVVATRGKAVRAEPVSALYEKGLVYHVEEFPELEDELCTTRFEDLTKSPNRLDALVWAITELAGETGEIIRFV